ncbi:hypothetical protein ABZZ20_21515 [Streptomyces sp. NPDC006430]|uniref:hypothetical protein n=1 Tax=Streptomyces sp. NPDC006430 TaxID=3154299 RepID=UPI0033BD1C32
MSTNRSRRIDRDTAEQLLGRSVVGAADGHEALVELLSAAAAPPADGELSGERAALAAFRAAQLAPAPVPVAQHPRRRPMLTSVLAKALSAKVAAAAVATALGGVAVAAGTGHLPAALGGGPNPGRAEPSDTSAAASRSVSPNPNPNPTTRAAAPLTAELAELCRAYDRARDAHPGELPAESRFTVLVTVAGGPDRVAGYCAPVREASGGPGATPAATDRPTAAPSSGRPTSRTEPPDNRPTSAGPGPGAVHTPNPTAAHPTGPPDSRPGTAPGTGDDQTFRPKE